jgi:hypothetical protein
MAMTRSNSISEKACPLLPLLRERRSGRWAVTAPECQANGCGMSPPAGDCDPPQPPFVKGGRRKPMADRRKPKAESRLPIAAMIHLPFHRAGLGNARRSIAKGPAAQEGLEVDVRKTCRARACGRGHATMSQAGLLAYGSCGLGTAFPRWPSGRSQAQWHSVPSPGRSQRRPRNGFAPFSLFSPARRREPEHLMTGSS